MGLPPKTGVIIGCALMMIGVVVVGMKADALILGLRSLWWPQTTALLSDANYWTTNSTDAKGRSKITYHGKHQYTFTVGGELYQGGNYDVVGHMHTGMKGRADRIQSAFVKGSTVPVFYDPAKPARCILKRGIAEDTQVALAFSAFFFFVGAIVLRYQLKRLGNSESSE
jgi:hypothetical protein